MARRTRVPAVDMEELVELLTRPESWAKLDPAVLSRLVLFQCFAYGVRGDPGRLEALVPLYGVFNEHAPWEVRQQTQQAVTQSVYGGSPVISLLPFILFDADLGIASSASLDYAVLMPLQQGDPLTGPKSLMALASDQELGEKIQTGILMGLVLLGDRRVMPLIRGCWRLLGPQGRQDLSAATSGHVTAGLIEFFLDWLEHTEEESNFGGVVGTLCRMPSIAHGGQVYDIERRFPANGPGTEEGPIRVLDSWTFPEYLKRIRPRLKRITARESEPKLTPQIVRYWGRESR